MSWVTVLHFLIKHKTIIAIIVAVIIYIITLAILQHKIEVIEKLEQRIVELEALNDTCSASVKTLKEELLSAQQQSYNTVAAVSDAYDKEMTEKKENNDKIHKIFDKKCPETNTDCSFSAFENDITAFYNDINNGWNSFADEYEGVKHEETH